MAAQVFVATHDPELGQAMVRRLAHTSELAFASLPGFNGLQRGDVVVTTSPHLPTSLCASLAGKGVLVVVLAALPSAGEQAEYLRAGGSAYLPMAVDVAPLQRELARLTGQHNGVVGHLS